MDQREALLTARWEVERLQADVARIEQRECELSMLHADADCLRSEAACLRAGCLEARSDANRIWGEISLLQRDLREANLRAEEAE
jgi:chromosome segregation ATPase